MFRCHYENEHQEKCIRLSRRSLSLNNNLVNEITASQLRNDLPEFSSGDEIKVSVRIREGNKTRLQIFQGVVIMRRGGGVSETFTVRKIPAVSVLKEHSSFILLSLQQFK